MDQRKRDQLQKWHENEEFDKIISALREVPQEEMDYDLTGQLARALNNADEYEEALQLLDSVEEEGREDDCWFYRRGYALYYLERYSEARAMFERAAELNPEDEDAPQFISACSAFIAYPAAIEPFRSRVKKFWEVFVEREEELRGAMDHREDYRPAMELVSELLHTAFADACYEMGHNGERYELILTPEGMKQRLFRLKYWKDHAPKELLDRWKFTVGRPACKNLEQFALQMYDVSLSSEDVTVWPEVQENKTIGLNVFSEPLLPLMEEDENKAYAMMAILLDQCIGEISVIENVTYLELMKKPELQLEEDDDADRFQGPMRLSELRSFIRKLKGTDEDEDESADAFCGVYTAYQMEPKTEDWWLREDVFVGNTCCVPVVREYYAGCTEIVDENVGDGVVFGFLYYPNEKVDQSEMVQFRADMEDEITELAGDSGQILGGATGSVYSYIDCVCYDLQEFIDAAAEVMNKRSLDEMVFHVFRRDCGGIDLKLEEADDEADDSAKAEPDDGTEAEPGDCAEGRADDCGCGCGCRECAGESGEGQAAADEPSEESGEAADGSGEEETEGGHGSEGHFQGFVLLNSVDADLDAIMETLRVDWGIVPDDDDDEADGVSPCGCGCEDHAHVHVHGDDCGCGECGGNGHDHVHSHDHAHHDSDSCGCGCGDHGHVHGDGCGCGGEDCGAPGIGETTRVFSCGDCLAAVSLMPAPIPDGEAEYFAKANYMWPEAEAVTKTHKAHLLVAVLPHGPSAVEAGTLFTKLTASCLKQENAIGVYTSGTVFQPEFYIEVADMMKEDEEALPILDWVYFGLYRTPKGNNAYTYGLTTFGRQEIEILESEKTLEELRDFLYQIASYIIGYDAVLQDGETIGFTEEQRLPITLSKGAAVEGESLKIEF